MRSHAKAESAGSTMRGAVGLGRIFRGAFACVLALLAFAGIGASTALADGNVDVTVTGTGSGTVTSTSQEKFGIGTSTPTPGEIDCDKTGGPICSANFDFNFGGFLHDGFVTLTATPEVGPFTGWAQSGASSVVEGCTNPAGSPETCKIALNGNGGPTSTVIAIFGDPPPSPDVLTGGTGPGGDFSLTTLEGTVDPGGFAVTDCFFEYGLTTSYGNTVPCEQDEGEIGSGEGPVAVSAEIGPLESNTTYNFRLVASSEVAPGIGGVSEGDNQAFTTADPPPLEVITTGTGPGANFALTALEGTVDPDGNAVTDCFFEYGLTTSYGSTVPCEQGEAEIGSGEGPVAVSASTEPLEPDTTYNFRLVASNEVAEGIGTISDGGNVAFTTASAPADSCPNASIRAEQGVAALLLPDCMALEMVSPPNKGGQGADGPDVSADGGRITFKSSAALGGTPGVFGFGSNLYLATREAAGWTTTYTVPPLPFSHAWNPEARAKSLTPDFSQWFQVATTSDLAQLGHARVYRAGPGGTFEPLSPDLFPVEDGAFHTDFMVFGSALQAASADHSHLVFTPGGRSLKIAFLPGDPAPAPEGPAAFNAYIAKLDETGQPSLELLARGTDATDGKLKVFGGNCGAWVGSAGSGAIKRNQGAISADGSRTIFTTRPAQPATGDCTTTPKLRILERTETASGPAIRELIKSECDRKASEPPCKTAAELNGDDRFQGASLDQTRVYFTSPRQLAASDLDTTLDLYLYDSTDPVGERLTQVSAGEDVAGHEVGKDGKAQDGTVAISADGSRVYFVAEGVLTEDEGPKGDKASDHAAGAPKLYLYTRDEDHPDGELAFLGALDPADEGNTALWGGQGTWRNSAYPVPIRGEDGTGAGDGHILLFLSKAPLTADDGDGGFRDAFRYDAETDTMARVSKAEEGGSDDGPVDLSSHTSGVARADSFGTDFAEKGRWASEDGETVVFQSVEPLVPGDHNGEGDSFIWRGGQLHRLPGTAGFIDADRAPTLSHDGDTVAFQADPQLLGHDGDTSPDIYVARVNGGYPNPVAEPPCEPDRSKPSPHCREEASSPPSTNDALSATAPSGGNVAPNPFARCNRAARQARALSNRAKRLRRAAKRSRRKAPRRARRLNRKANRLAKRARATSKRATRCRRNVRRAVR